MNRRVVLLLLLVMSARGRVLLIGVVLSVLLHLLRMCRPLLLEVLEFFFRVDLLFV